MRSWNTALPLMVPFPPLSLSTVFADELRLSAVILTLNKIWPQEPIVTKGDAGSLTTPHSYHPSQNQKIPKPRGEVTRLSRNGYSLRQALGWDAEYYHKVQVSMYNTCKDASPQS